MKTKNLINREWTQIDANENVRSSRFSVIDDNVFKQKLELQTQEFSVHPRSFAAASNSARERFLVTERRPLFLADWRNVVFIHFEVDPAALQSDVPFELDLHSGHAFVSLVAFSQQRLRFAAVPSLTTWMGALAANHEFLNFRTYVRHGNEVGIYFLAEWVNNRLAPFFGPRMYGFPYRAGQIDYQKRKISGDAIALECGSLLPLSTVKLASLKNFPRGSELPPPKAPASWRTPKNGGIPTPTASSRPKINPMLKFRAQEIGAPRAPLQSSHTASLDEFLLERYTAFTERNGARRFFRIWHAPWQQTPIEIEINDASLLQEWPWMKNARVAGVNYSPGVHDVWIGKPNQLKGGIP